MYPFICLFIAPYMPPTSIGTSSEPHWNLIGTSLEPHRRNTEGRAKHYRALAAKNTEGRAKHYRAISLPFAKRLRMEKQRIVK